VAIPQRVYKTRITDLDKPKQPLRTERTKLDHVVITAAIHQWHRQLVQISDVCSVPSLAVFPTCCYQIIQIWRVWTLQ